ncbi:hypothetical protein [Nocardiopsis sp. CNT312]|uniref:hypothetical protein n=1 Tax=Nocardiopsis sp. CNT312 TaxID=1137268 RepID=UPI00048B5A34|nr:hypothetical protein [Nocardiopsis sp. CNT312]
MSRASRPGQSRPTVVIVIAPDERSAEIAVEGHRQTVVGRVPKETRRAALDVATGYAARVGQPVLVDARDASGFWHLVATPDGVVRAADRVDPGPVPAPRPSERARGGAGRRLLIVGAAALALVLVAAVGVFVLRYLPGSPLASGTDTEGTGEGGDGAPERLAVAAPPGFSRMIAFERPVAPGSEVRISRDGEHMSHVDPEGRLTLSDTAGEPLWQVELPGDPAGFLGAPRFVEYGGDEAIVIETAEALWFWPLDDPEPASVDLPDGARVQYVGGSPLVFDGGEPSVPVDGGLEGVDPPEGAGAMFATGGRVLAARVSGPWFWIDRDGIVAEVAGRRPEGAGGVDSVVTALREYVLVLWQPGQGEDGHLTYHDREDGSVVGTVEVDPADLEDVDHRSLAVGTDILGYGHTVVDPGTGEGVAVSGFASQIAVGDQVFGHMDDGRSVAVGADGEPVELADGATFPVGLLGTNAIVVHDDHLYAISPR